MKVLSAVLVLVSAAAILQYNTAAAACDVCGSCLNCGDHGYCAVSFGTAVCYCDAGWRGTLCNELDPNQIPIVSSPCDPNPCQNSGHCNPHDDGYICTCMAFFTGTNCVETTTLNPCELAAQVADPCPGRQCVWFQGGGHYCSS
ncbi:fibropellin-1-like isoform X2 [Patiria miniata]|uniref:EGF-like domain-containing protein n=1 Tax=Patiria miniata TaxID=46514 RepID=A0A914B452_PATMI|nr:fibropellin-1-like isoform X2 [Patiria miniata]